MIKLISESAFFPCLCKLFARATLLLGISILLACSESETDTSEKRSIHLKQTKAYFSQGQYGAAMIEAKNAIQLGPQQVEGHLALVRIYNELGQSTPALRHQEQNPFPASADYIFEQTSAYIAKGKYNSALNALKKDKSLLQAKDPLKYLFQQATVLRGQGKYEEAVNIYQQALKISANDLDSLLGLAETYATLQQNHQSFQLLEQIKKIYPSDSASLVFEAQLALRDGDLDEGEALLTEALTSLPNTDIMTPIKAKVLGALSEILTRQGRPSEALIYTRLLADAFPGAQIHKAKYQDAVDHFKNGEYKKSQSLLQEILSEVPTFDQANQLLAMIKYAQGDIAAAEKYFSDSIDPEIAGSAPLQVYAMTNLKLNRPEEAMKILEGAVNDDKNPQLIALYGLAALSSGNMEKGLKAIKKALSLSPEDIRLYLALAQYENTENADPAAALQHLQNAYNVQADSILIRRALVHQHLTMNKPEHAAQLVNNFLASDGSDVKNQILAGDFAKSQGKIEDAIKHFNTANKLAPTETGPLISLGKAHVINLDWQSANGAFDKAWKLDKSNQDAIIGLLTSADALETLDKTIDRIVKNTSDKKAKSNIYLSVTAYYTRKNDYPNAEKYLELIGDDSSIGDNLIKLHASIAYKKGLRFLSTGKFAEARQAAMAGLKHTPDSSMLLILLAEAEIKSKDYTEAEKVIEQILVMDKSAALLLRGDILQQKGELESALKTFKDAWQTKPSNILGVRIHRALTITKKQDQMPAFLDKWINAVPLSSEAHTARGTLRFSSGNLKEAVYDLEKAIELKPRAIIALNNLAWIYHSLGNAKAKPVAKRAVQLAPNSPAVLDTYGWILHEQGDYNEAVTYLKKAAELAPENSEIQSHFKQAKAANQPAS